MSGNVDNGLCDTKLNCDGEVPSVCGHNVHAAGAAATFSTQQIKVVKQKASGKELCVPQTLADDSDDAAWFGVFKLVKYCTIDAAEGAKLAKDFLVAVATQMDKTSGL